jgi:hypothetical protein
MKKKDIKFYNEHGFLIKKNYLSKKLCNELKISIKNLQPKLKIPFSNQALGFGDVRNINPYSKILSDTNISNDVSNLINITPELSHFMLVNKAAWIGPEVEWHQEVFNMEIYAPGVDKKKHWNKFIQIFIAIDSQNRENGCLRVFDKSHKAGILDYEDIVNINCSHKRRVSINDLERINSNYKILDIELEKGDIMFFNHLLVHGSQSNNSSSSRISALLQFYEKSLSFDISNFHKYKNFRRKFVENWLRDSLNNIDQYKKNLDDFKKNKFKL